MKNISMKKFRKLYMEHIDNSTPDMDSIWEKIESGLEPKPENGITSKPVQKKINFRQIAVWGTVCAAAVLIIPISARIMNDSSISNELATGEAAYEQAINGSDGDMYDGGAYINNDNAGSYDGAASEDMNGDAAAENSDSAVSEEAYDGICKRVVFYEDIFDHSDETPVPSAATSGDDFFVEENVLIETDMIVNAYVNNVYSKGDTVCYELTAENAETSETEQIVLESATPYVMHQGGSYILPLKAENGDYRLVFENAPQIEVSEKGSMVFHNGWKTLDALEENPIDVIYPQNGIDDFFYDRMRFTYSSDISPLIDKWHQVKFGILEEQ